MLKVMIILDVQPKFFPQRKAWLITTMSHSKYSPFVEEDKIEKLLYWSLHQNLIQPKLPKSVDNVDLSRYSIPPFFVFSSLVYTKNVWGEHFTF